MELWLTSSDDHPIACTSFKQIESSNRDEEAPTAPPTLKHSRSSSSGRSELIAEDKTKKRSAKKRTVLDDLSHGTHY